MKQQIIAYWQQLQARERNVLVLGCVLVLAMLTYQFLLSPWQKSINYMQTALVDHRKNLTWMQQRAEQLTASGGVQRVQYQGANQSLLAVIEQSARKFKVNKSIKQLSPVNNGREVSVVLEDTSFNQWVRWVDNLQSTYGVKIVQLSAEREGDKPDIAEVRVNFSRE